MISTAVDRLVCPKGCGKTAPAQRLKSAVVSHNCEKARRMIDFVPMCAIMETDRRQTETT